MIITRNYIQSFSEIINLQLGIPENYKHECIDEIYKIGNSIDDYTNLKAIRSTYHIWEETEVLNLLLDKIIDTISELLKYDCKLANAWSAIYQKGHYADKHDHKPTFLSFVYYLKSPNEKTPLVFDNNFSITPKDDTLIIFPSHLKHSVPIHEDKEDRICVAGNLEHKEYSLTRFYKPSLSA
jgi:hypothetical protein